MPYMSKLVKRLALGWSLIILGSACADASNNATEPEEPAPGDRPSVASVRVLPETLDVLEGRQVRLVAEPRDANGQLLLQDTVTWASSDPTIATVDASGSIRALRDGEAEITARVRDRSGRGRVRVQRIAVHRLAISPDAPALTVGQAVSLAATTYSTTDSVLAGRTVTWSTSAAAIATVDATGRVNGVAAGNARVVAASEGRADTVTVTVTAPAPPPPSLPGTVGDLAVTAATDSSITLRFTEVTNGAGGAASYEIRLMTGTFSWGSATAVTVGTCRAPMAGTSVGTVRSCLVRGLAAATQYRFQVRAFRGTFNVDAVFGAGSNVATGTTAAAPAPPPAPVASVVVSPAVDTVAVNATITLSTTLRDAASNILTGRAVSWSSSNTTVATVSSGGVVTGRAAGTATITATSEGRTGTASVLVPAAAPPPPPPPPPGGGTAIFSSDWSAGQGNTQAAVTDGGRWPVLVCGNTYSQVLRVVGASTVGFSETANVLRLQQLGPGPCGMLQVNDVVPASTTHWGRFYVRNDENGNSGDHPTGYNNAHWQGGDIQAVPWVRESSSHVSNGTWRISVGGGAPYPFRKWWGPALQNGVWYRYEWEMRYVGASTYQFWPRVYDANGVLIADADDFVQEDYPGAGTQTLARWYAAGSLSSLGSPTQARHFGMGHEGTTGSATGGYWYYGKFAMSTTGWLGR